MYLHKVLAQKSGVLRNALWIKAFVTKQDNVQPFKFCREKIMRTTKHSMS